MNPRPTEAQEPVQNQIEHALRVGGVFGRLDAAVLKELRTELELRLLQSGEVLLREGDESDALYVVISGRLRVTVQQEGGGSATLYELRRGQTVGEIGVLAESRRTATVTAVRDSLLARLSRAAFDRLLVAHPRAMLRQFAAPIIRVLQEQVGHSRRPANEVVNITVLPLHDTVDLSNFTSQLAEKLSRAGPTLLLTSTALDEALAQPGAAQTPGNGPASIAVVSWLNEQEIACRYVVYQVDSEATQWTRRCLRQADHILLVGDASASPDIGSMEKALFSDAEAPLLCRRSLVLLHPAGTERPSGTRLWLDARPVAAHYHVRRDDPEAMARLARLATGRGVGVVLSGGGAAGFGHIGAIKALRQAGVPIDLIGGTSAGGLMACQHAMGWDFAAVMAKNRAAIRYKFDYTLPITSLMAGEEMTKSMREMFADAQLEDTWLPCFCVTANLSRAGMMVHERGPVWKYARATTSLPGVLPPVFDGGEMLVDGGLLNNLPTDVMQKRVDCDKVIALDVSGAAAWGAGSAMPYESSMSGWHLLWRRLNPFVASARVPTLSHIMMRVAVINDAQHVKTTRALADFYMPLAITGYGMLDFRALEEIVEAGHRSAVEILARWEQDEKLATLRS